MKINGVTVIQGQTNVHPVEVTRIFSGKNINAKRSGE